jgi:hypothetical protein
MTQREGCRQRAVVHRTVSSEAGHDDVLDVLLVKLFVTGDGTELHLVLRNLLALVLAVEQRGDFLKRERAVRTLRLDDRKIEPNELHAEPRSVDGIVLVSKLWKRDRIHCAW